MFYQVFFFFFLVGPSRDVIKYIVRRDGHMYSMMHGFRLFVRLRTQCNTIITK